VSWLPIHRSARYALQGADRDVATGNPGLWWDRFFDEWSAPGSENWPQPRPRKDGYPGGKEAWLRRFVGKALGDPTSLQEWQGRMQRLVEAQRGRSKPMQLQPPFVTGMGQPHPVENGFLWHHTLGVPYLPASGIKSMVSRFASDVLQANGTDPDAADVTIKRLFGSPGDEPGGGVGSVAFLDALPTRPVEVGVELVNPHAGKFLEDDDAVVHAPAAWVEPVPVPFLVVAGEVPFLFCLLGCPRPGIPDDRIEADLEIAERWLTGALEWLGAGAKTASAYGRFFA